MSFSAENVWNICQCISVIESPKFSFWQCCWGWESKLYRPFYSCVFNYLAFKCKQDWSWSCFDTDLSAFSFKCHLVSIRTTWFTQQKQWPVHQNKFASSLAAIHCKARSLCRQLLNGLLSLYLVLFTQQMTGEKKCSVVHDLGEKFSAIHDWISHAFFVSPSFRLPPRKNQELPSITFFLGVEYGYMLATLDFLPLHLSRMHWKKD